MTIDRYFLDGFRDEVAYEELTTLPVFPLVRELEFKYGLKVLCKSHIQVAYERVDTWQLVNKVGIAVCEVFTRAGDKGKLEYCYLSPFYQKARTARGDSQSRGIIHSIKVGSLMATLTRQKVVPGMTELIDRKVKQVKNATTIMRRALGESHKDNPFSTNEIHAILAQALGKNTYGNSHHVDQNKCQETLDKYNEADRVAALKAEEADRMFTNPFYMIGVDACGDYLIGKFKLSKDAGIGVSYETVEEFKRYRTYEDVPDLIPIMTMTKVAYENSQHRKTGLLPTIDEYDQGLDAVFFYSTQPTRYEHTWMVTPCPTY